jgi:hypothetical protein
MTTVLLIGLLVWMVRVEYRLWINITGPSASGFIRPSPQSTPAAAEE